jgi:hypothetical protein
MKKSLFISLFGHLKRPLENPFGWALSRYFRTTESIRSTLRKKKKIKMHPWSFSGKKIQNSTFLKIGAWNFYSRVLWYAESDDVIFIKVLSLLGVVSLFFFENKANFLRRLTFDG